MVYTPGALVKDLGEGWVFDPWLNPRGNPIGIGGPVPVAGHIDETDSPVYWVLVRGTPEQIAGLNPFVELPAEEEPEEPKAIDYVGINSEFIPFDEKGKPIREPKPGWVILHKDHYQTKGSNPGVFYTLPPDAPEAE